jgi:phosphatidylserine/phosphatidylglycerophosphate/cardiolipin synthase-like enzyme
MVVVRVGNLADADSVHVAYCGGVDLAFTRRDAPGAGVLYDPATPRVLGGDWQSGDGLALDQWPFDSSTRYDSVTKVRSNYGTVGVRQGSDLPASVYGDGQANHQIWHDQHIRFEGPFVATLEAQFCERWRDAGRTYAFEGDLSGMYFRSQQVIFSSKSAVSDHEIVPLPDPVAVPSVNGATSFVQMWRTIPFRRLRVKQKSSQLTRGEFTCQAGIANATVQATELIWIFDQYFWSRPLARLLNQQLLAVGSLRVLVILPSYADDHYNRIHWARKLALDDLTAGDASIGRRVGVYNLWHGKWNRGVYCHAKTQTYDDKLLVCGSCNLNRRSFLCDTEIAAAVLDETVVRSHHARLLQLLGLPLVEPDYATPGWGAGLFTAIQQAVPAQPTAATLLWPDPWAAGATAKMPNGVTRKQAAGLFFDQFYGNLLDPTSLPMSVDSYVAPDGTIKDATLATIVEQLESSPKRPWE